MTTATAPTTTGAQLGYARVSTEHQSLDQQLDARKGDAIVVIGAPNHRSRRVGTISPKAV